MYYIGKQYDTFSPAIAQMLSYRRFPPCDWIGCASLRCFGFHTNGSADSWFRPFVPLPEALRALSDALRTDLTVRKVASLSELPEFCDEFVAGPLKSGLAVPGIWEYYYRGGEHFLFCIRSGDDMTVYDPLGTAGMRVTTSTLERTLFPAWCVWIEQGVRKAEPYATPTEILRRGKRYHREIAGQERRELAQACAAYQPGRGNGLSLRCGLVNLTLHFEQAFRLAERCGWKQGEEYREAKQRVYACYNGGVVDGLPDAVERLWDLLN